MLQRAVPVPIGATIAEDASLTAWHWGTEVDSYNECEIDLSVMGTKKTFPYTFLHNSCQIALWIPFLHLLVLWMIVPTTTGEFNNPLYIERLICIGYYSHRLCKHKTLKFGQLKHATFQTRHSITTRLNKMSSSSSTALSAELILSHRHST